MRVLRVIPIRSKKFLDLRSEFFFAEYPDFLGFRLRLKAQLIVDPDKFDFQLPSLAVLAMMDGHQESQWRPTLSRLRRRIGMVNLNGSSHCSTR